MPFLERRITKTNHFTGDMNFLRGGRKLSKMMTVELLSKFSTWPVPRAALPFASQVALRVCLKAALGFPCLSQQEFLRCGRERDLLTFKKRPIHL